MLCYAQQQLAWKRVYYLTKQTTSLISNAGLQRPTYVIDPDINDSFLQENQSNTFCSESDRHLEWKATRLTIGKFSEADVNDGSMQAHAISGNSMNDPAPEGKRTG